MPRVSQYSDWISGVGAGVALNGAEIAPRGTVACFLDPTRVIYNRRFTVGPPEKWGLEVYDVATKEHEPVSFGERGANFLSARGGRWMAFLAGVGVYDATGTIWPAAGLAGVGTDGRGAIGADGTIGFIRDYQGGHGLQLLTPSGEAVDLPDVAISSLSIYDRALAVWVEGGQVRAWGRSQPAVQAEPVSSARVVTTGGEWFLLVTTNTRLILRQWDAPIGKVIVPTPTGFAGDAAALSASKIRVVWSRTVGERPEDIEFQDVAVADLIEPIAAPAVPIPAIGRTLWCGWFTGTPAPGGGWTTDTDPRSLPGNCYVSIPSGEITTDDGRRIGWYVEGRPDTDLDAINQAIAAVALAHPGDRLVAYWPRQTAGRPTGADLAVEGYQLRGEAVSAYEARCRAKLAQAGAGAWFIPQVFTSNDSLTTDLVAIIPVAARIARDTGAHLLMFNGTGRATGYQDHPEVHAGYATLFAGITGTPNPEHRTPNPDPRSPIPDPTPPRPVPTPAPAPSPVPSTPFPPARSLAGVRMKVYAKLGSHYIGVAPTALAKVSGDAQFPVYHDRSAANGWEAIELTPKDGGHFLARFMDADRGLSIQNDGSLQTRAAGTDGPFEQLYATTQPDGISILYRVDNGVMVGTPLTIEEVQ